MTSDALAWTRVDWKYHATDEFGTRWHITQRTSATWEIYEDGSLWNEAGSLRDAKVWVEDELKNRRDPEREARIERRRLAARARRAARMLAGRTPTG